MSQGRYGTVHAAFWEDEKVQRWSDQARLLALYLLTSRHSTAAGAMRVPAGYIAADLGWAIEKIDAAFDELETARFAVRDRRTGWTVIRNRLRYDPPKSPNNIKGVAFVIQTVPKNWRGYKALHEAFYEVTDGSVRIDDPALDEPFDPPPDPLRSPFEAPSKPLLGHAEPPSEPFRTPNPNPNPIPNQDTAEAEKSEPVGQVGVVVSLHPARAGSPPERFAWAGSVIRLTQRDFDRWREAYAAIRDLKAELQALDDWLIGLPPTAKERASWFHVVSGALRKKHAGALAAAKPAKPKSDPDFDPLEEFAGPSPWARKAKS